MKKNKVRKSTAVISLVLVPMNLLGLGFTAGCDKGDDRGSFTQDTDQAEVVDFDAQDPNDPYTLEPVSNFAGGPPATQPTTQPLASSGFARYPAHHYGAYTYRPGHTTYVPVPYHPSYRPVYRPAYRSSPSGSSWSSSSSGYRSSGVSRSTPSRSSGSSGSSHSSSVSRGGFGSTGHSMSSGS